MIAARRVFGLIWNGFACVGALFSALVLAVFVMMMIPQHYEAPAPASLAPEPATLQDASSLLQQSGIQPAKTHTLIAGKSRNWSEDDGLEAYCVGVSETPVGVDWSDSNALEPQFARAIAAGLEVGHARLPCIPPGSRVGDPLLRARIISIGFESRFPREVKFALHDPAMGVVYLLSANLPRPRQAEVARALL